MNKHQHPATWADKAYAPSLAGAPTHPRTAVPVVLAAIEAAAIPDVPADLAALPGALARFEAFERAVLAGPVPAGPGQMVDRYAAAIVTGDTTVADPRKFGDDVLAAGQVAARADALPYSLSAVRRRIESAVAAALDAGRDDVLDRLRGMVEHALTGAEAATRALDGLDITEPASLASATDEQRAAFRELQDLAVQYARARFLQVAVLAVSERVVGRTDLSPTTYGWKDTLATGLAEHRDVTLGDHGVPTDLPHVTRLLAAVRRGDAWLPSTADLASAWSVLGRPKSEREERDEEEPKVKVTDRRRVATATFAG